MDSAYILDSYALLAHFEDEESGAEEVRFVTDDPEFKKFGAALPVAWIACRHTWRPSAGTSGLPAGD